MTVIIFKTLTSCEFNTQIKKKEDIYFANSHISSWNQIQGSENSTEIASERGTLVKLKPELNDIPIVDQNIKILDSGSYFLLGKLNLMIERGSFFIIVSGSDYTKKIEFFDSIEISKRALLSVYVPEPVTINLKLGFSDNSVGEAFPDSLSFYKEEYLYKHSKEQDIMKQKILDVLSLEKFSESNFDENVDKITRAVNQSLLEKGGEKTARLRSLFSSNKFDSKKTAYLHEYIQDDSVRYSYCQKSSLSVDEILKLFQIQVRQLHWHNKNVGFHQFLEYYNPFDKQWKIIDPFYSVRYIDKHGNYLGFENVEKLIRGGEFTNKNILTLNLDGLYYQEEDIMNGWQAELTVIITKK